MKVLGIETSCDETGVAVVEDGTRVLSNVVASQVEIHARYGGIVPEVAARQHQLAIIPILRKALEEAHAEISDLAAVCVTHGPGLAGSLLVGVNLAKALAVAWARPLIGVNHLEGHVYANWLEEDAASTLSDFPLVCLIVSGGHTNLVLMKGHGDYEALGQTRDDAAGEAFDKVARILGLGYPGGPAIERAARDRIARQRLPRAWIKGTDDFSFSGLKTAVVQLRKNTGDDVPAADIAAGFQEAVVDVLVTKTVASAVRHGAKQIVLGGGVVVNRLLRETMIRRSPLPVRIPRPAFCTDNAAMIAACGHFRFIAGNTSGWDLDVKPSLTLA